MKRTPRNERRRHAVALLMGACAAASAMAQGTPVFTAPLVHPPSVAEAPPPAPRVPVTAPRIAGWFADACVVTQAEPGAAVDWALSNGFEPVDPMRGSLDGLLDGRSGSVLAAPDTDGQVLLVAAQGRCTVWAEQQEGPPVRAALAAAVGTLTAKGARARLEMERNVERSGAWRSQVQWRYKAVGASVDLGVGAVTTLAKARGTQVLNAEPLAKAVNFSPEGIPLP